MAYLVVLIRIVLFKQVALYNLFAAIGSMERTISIIPFKSLLDMINNNISVTRILENILGNIAIFIPFGLLLPIVQKDKSKKIILYGLITSALIEIIQYVFALGSSDIDDLMLNTLGTVIGYLLYKIIHKKARADTLTAISIIVLVTVLGGFALGILFINHTELFMLSSNEIVVENNIHSSTDTRTIMDLEITPNSNIYICYNKIDYFFSTISGEQISYEKIEYSDFLSQNSNSFTKENNVRIWSSDGKTIDNLVITEWIE